MGILDRLFNKDHGVNVDDDVIVAVCDGTIIPTEKIADDVVSKSLMGKTLGIEPDNGKIVAPCNGKIEMIFPTGHAFGMRMKDGTGLLIHIGIDTVEMHGQGFKILKKADEVVKAGETIIDVNLDMVRKAKHPCTVMTIITESIEGINYNFNSEGKVLKGQSVSIK